MHEPAPPSGGQARDRPDRGLVVVCMATLSVALVLTGGTALAGSPANATGAAPPVLVPGEEPRAAASVPSDVVLASDVQIERTQIQDAPGDTVVLTIRLHHDGTLAVDERLGGYLFVGGLNAGMLDRVLVVEDDPDSDRTVRVRINTFEIGRTPTARLTRANSGYAVETSGGDGDTIAAVSRPRPPSVEDRLAEELPNPLPAGTYDLRVSTSATVRADDDGEYLIFPDQTDAAHLYLSAAVDTPREGIDPVISITPVRPEPGEAVTFDASGSTAASGSIFTVEWDFDNDGEVEAEGETVTHTFSTSGDHLVGIRLTDDNANEVVVGRTVVVNRPPVANVTLSARRAVVGESVWFNATQSSDADGRVVRYAWDLDGDHVAERTGERIRIQFDASGTHNVTVIVTDDRNATASATATVTVVEPTPTVTATATPTATPTATATATATATRTTTKRTKHAAPVAGDRAFPTVPLAALVVVVAFAAGALLARR